MSLAVGNPARSTPSDPPQDRSDALAATATRSGRLIGLVHKLIDYGRDLLSALQHSPAPETLRNATRNFGTRDMALILARIMRGLRYAAMLEERVLGAAARLDKSAPASTPGAATAAAAGGASRHAPASHQPQPASPAPQRDDIAALLAGLPTPEQIAADIRRRPIGAVLADIASDLGMVAADPLWRELKDAVATYGGSFIRLVRDMFKRSGALLLADYPRDLRLIPPMPPGWQPPRTVATTRPP